MKAALCHCNNLREGAGSKMIQKSEDLPEQLMNIRSA
jgi:hypothetical protein